MNRLRSRLILATILALFIVPLVLAWLMTSGAISIGKHETRNQGQLVIPAVPLDWSGAANPDNPAQNAAYDGFWVILYAVPSPCGKQCLELAAGLRQVHRATGQNFQRVKIALLLHPGNPESLDRELHNIYSRFNLIPSASTAFTDAISEAGGRAAGLNADLAVYLVDPDGNIMMTYHGVSSPRKLIKDLERLLTWSKQDKPL